MPGPLVPVLMAGGSGTRLWPLSRELYPKQLLRLTGGRTLLQDAVLRAQRIPGARSPLVLCGDAHRFLVREQLAEIGADGATVILEPEGRSTAPAAAVGALYVQEHWGPEALVFLMSADQAVANRTAFAKAAGAAARAARTGLLVTFGIRPTRPETGYGYLKAGAPLPVRGRRRPEAFRVEAFVEKPDARRAAAFLRRGSYYWNGGLFLFRADALVAEMKRLEPDLLSACRAALARARHDLGFTRLDARAFSKARHESLDYAVMEKSDRIALVPLDAGWDDVGSWRSLYRRAARDRSGNATSGDVWLADAHDCLVRAEHRLVAAVGVRDQVIVETRDAVLVTTPEAAPRVKEIVAALRARKRPEALDPPRVYRPWGWYESVAAGDRFQVKRIAVKPGHRLSLQRHRRRAEHWVVVAGTARITCDGRVFDLSENQSTFIPLGAKHRLENATESPLEVIEVQSGAYLGEDDIERFDDAYGRAPP